ncbi:MAG: 4Fe-4S domain-containing protein [Phycisphaerae bacterium]
MATKEVVTKVWIEDGCIVCDACETAAPDVFEVQEETCVIRPEALAAGFTKPRTDEINDAAEECPVDVIKFETVSEEVADAAPAGEAEKTESAPATDKPAAKAPPKKAPATEKKPAKVEAAAKATPSKTPAPASAAGAPDPAIAALLKAATARGGNAGITKGAGGLIGDAGELLGKRSDQLPPDARQTKILQAARKTSQSPDHERRTVAGGAALAIGWTAFGVGTGVSAGPAFVRFLMPNVLEEPDPQVRVGSIKTYLEMAPGSVNEDYKPQGIWMIREEERIAALSIICTHLGCIPNWLPNDRKFKCPCHGSGYRPNGINFEGPTPRPLERFRITMDGGTVVVDKSKKFQYELGQWDQPGSYLPV